MKNPTLIDTWPLYKLGFAIHWVLPKSKRPFESKWTTGSRKKWNYLVEAFTENLNVGVRMGAPSKIGDNYLACIDVDVKDPAYRKEAITKLREIIGEKKLPEVRSGSGNGSRHLYCVTASPFKMITIAKHTGWEICIYSDGRQMVLPPSTHPSGGKYVWKVPLSSIKDLPLLDFSKYKEPEEIKGSKEENPSKGKIQEILFDFEIDNSIDIRSTQKISEKIRSLIVKGVWKGKMITDRSAYLLPAANALVSANFTKNQVLTILTDRSTHLGETAYGVSHANTGSRKRAAKWLWRYTVKRIFDDRNEWAALSSEEKGFYRKGPNGGDVPDYDSLLVQFEKEYPYKSVADMKAVYVFNGTHYSDCTPIEIRAFAERKFTPKPSDKVRGEFYNKVLVNNVSRRTFFIETTESKINFRNGVFDLNSAAVLSDHSPIYGFRGTLPYDFDPKARCPLFKKWLSDIMIGDKDLIAILQEYMGYIVRGGEYKFHKALWLEGVGRNGKSTFIDVLKALIGVGNYSTVSIKSLIGDKFSGAELDGKIANFSEETSPQELADSGPFKNLTGDGDTSVQKKYGDPYSFRNRAKLVMSYNQIPDLKDLSPGMLSRPLIVPFKKRIGEVEQDHNLKEKLFSELPGIFNFALKGWERLELQNHFTRSEKSALALKRVGNESCNVYQWIKHHVDFDDDKDLTFRSADLYALYKAHERYAYKLTEFGRRLNRHPEIRKRHRHTSTGSTYWGLKLNTQSFIRVE